MQENKSHWYDGMFYDHFIAPHQDKVFAQLKEMLTKGSTVLDVGCGTGRLASQLLDKCERIEIIDLSERNIHIARRKLADVPPAKLHIERADLLEFVVHNVIRFDFAIVSYVLHEIREEERDVLLWALSSVADKIVVVDYLVPQPGNYRGLVNHLVEYAAGREHYRNFKSFVRGDGIAGLLKKVPLRVISEVKDDACSSHVALLEGRGGGNRGARPPCPIQNTNLDKSRRRRILWRRTVKEKVFL